MLPTIRQEISAEQALRTLRGHLWHTTSRERFESIRKSGAILVNPDIPDEERWKTSGGPKYYPYVRKLGGVSLFDFGEFDPETYDERYRLSNWRSFVPICYMWDSAVWIEIDRQGVAEMLITGERLLQRWKEEKQQRHTIMPLIEAAHLGDLSLTSCVRALLIRKNDTEFRDLEL